MGRNFIKKNSLRAIIKRFRRSEDASVAVEFGFVAPVFFLLILVFIELAAMIFIEYSMEVAATATARQIRTGQAQNSKWSSTEFKKEFCRTAKLILNCESSVKVFVKAGLSFTQIAADAPKFNEVGADKDGADKNTSFACGLPLDVVAVIITFDRKFVLPVMDYFGNTPKKGMRRLIATSVFKNEPYLKTAECAPVASQ
jgi:Flp pilus assembly protein TadG